MIFYCYWCGRRCDGQPDPALCGDCQEAFKHGTQHDRPKVNDRAVDEIGEEYDTISQEGWAW